MTIHQVKIIPFEHKYLPALIELSLKAWAPVFESIKAALEPAVYQTFYPEGWQPIKQKLIEDSCQDNAILTWLAIQKDHVCGFVSLKLTEEMGEIYLIGVHPDYQKQGIASLLGEFALQQMRKKGIPIAMVETGGDHGHRPARQTYEKLGFKELPISRYFLKL